MPVNVSSIGNTGEKMSKVSMRLFGMPYQLPNTVDPRDDVINPAIGKHFLEKFLLEAPILTVVPGDPLFMPEYHGSQSKSGAAVALLEAADGGSGKFSAITSAFSEDDNDIRLYDFKKSYREYMKYVNLLCRVGAGYLDISDADLNFGSASGKAGDFDWTNYKWTDSGTNAQNFASWVKSAFFAVSSGGIRMGDGEDDNGFDFFSVLNDYEFVQFYIDPEGISNDDMGNTSNESMLKGLFDGVSSKTKEIAWMLRNSELAGNMANTAAESTEALGSMVTEALTGSQAGVSSLTSALSRVINLSSNVVLGENIIIPNIYGNSTYNKSGFSATIHLKAPYGNLLSYYLDVFVPLMHLVALTIPRQSSPNTYSAPFLCKSFVEGSWTCNLGLVTGLSISKANDSRSVNGLPSEVDVTIQFEDLYSTLTMNPTTEPTRFAKNPSLVEYLATNCGMSLTKPNVQKKTSTVISSYLDAFGDIPGNIKGGVLGNIHDATIGKLRSLFGF